MELEPFVDCLECGRKQHQICVLHLEAIWPGGFVCHNCLKEKGKRRKGNKYNAQQLPPTKLGDYIENRVNNFLKVEEADAGKVHIRVVSSTDILFIVRPRMKKLFDDFESELPYRAKLIFAFEEIDGVDVCFFGMRVQECDSECSPPNTRRVQIDYLDSVQMFQPRQYRTAVYHEILLGYLDHAKGLGYTMAHIWACPPVEDDDYIFYCHPPHQKVPKPKHLQGWYKKMLDKGIIDGTILEYKDIFTQAIEDKVASVADLPYLANGFWPNYIDRTIKELEQTAKEGENQSKEVTRNDLTAKMFESMEKHKDEFFVIRLHSAQSAASLPVSFSFHFNFEHLMNERNVFFFYLQPIQDPDPLIRCDLMDNRETFLKLAYNRNLEFSSLRRTKFSTLCMLYELHNQMKVDTCDP